MSRGKCRRTPVCLALLLALPSICLARSQGHSHKKSQPKAPAEIRVVSRLVTVSVVVRGKHGYPVVGLSRKDFTILDDGHPQRIAFFRAPNPSEASPSPRSLPPNVYSNIAQGTPGSAPGLTILLLDSINSELLYQQTARDAVIRFLRRIQSRDRLALYALGTRLIVLHDFTANPAALLAALNRAGSTIRYKSAPDAPVAPDTLPYTLPELNRIIAQTNTSTSGFNKDTRLDLTLRALDQIAAHVAGFPGRKNLLWVTGSLPFCFCSSDGNLAPSYLEKIQRTEALLSSDNVSVYPVDVRGLVAEDSTITRTLDTGAPSNSMYFAENEIASTTGGVAFHGSNDVQRAIQRAASDADSSYLVGYYPDHGDWKGEFRKIAVKVDRHGLQVSARSGYYATPAAPVEQTTLAQLAVSPLDSTGIRISAQVIPQPAKTGSRVKLIVGFDPSGMRFTRQADREVAQLEIGIYQKDAQGRIVEGGERTIRVAAPAATFAKAETEGMRMAFNFSLSANTSSLVLVLRDPGTGITGSLPIPVRNGLAGAAN